MGVQVTIRPHRVTDERGRDVEFDQYQILVGQRVMGYLGKLPGCVPKLVVRDVPQDVLSAINAAAAKVLGGETSAAVSLQPIGVDPAKEPVSPPPPTDAADDAELEAELAAPAE